MSVACKQVLCIPAWTKEQQAHWAGMVFLQVFDLAYERAANSVGFPLKPLKRYWKLALFVYLFWFAETIILVRITPVFLRLFDTKIGAYMMCFAF